MVSIRLALTLTLVSFLCASPAGDLNVKAKEVVSQNGRDNSIVIKKNVLDVKEDDKNIIKEEEEPIFRHGLTGVNLEDELIDVARDDPLWIHHHDVDSITVTDDEEVIERDIIIEEKVEEVEEEVEPHDGPSFKIPFDIKF